jgi:hypothetical protein
MIAGGGVFAALAVWGTVVIVKRFLRTTEEVTVHETCVCGSGRVRYRMTVDGVETRATVEVEPSPAFADLLDDRHEHEWQFRNSHTERHRGFSGSSGVGCGRGARLNRFTSLYNGNAAFRSLVLGRIQAREITRARAARFVFAADDAPDGAFPEDAEGPFDDFRGAPYLAPWR